MENKSTIEDDNQSLSIPFASSLEVFQVAAPTAVMIDRIITPIWYAIGVVGNPICTKIWLDRKMRKNNSSAIYLGSIAIVHLIFICLHIWVELLFAYNVSTYNFTIGCEIFNILYMTPQCAAPLLILGFTVERYIAICHPFTKEKYCTVTRAVKVVAFLLAIALCFSSVQAYIWTFHKSLPSGCHIRSTATDFNLVWTWLSETLIFGVVPFSVLIFNILVIKEIKKISLSNTSVGGCKDHGSGSNQTSTITLLSVSFYLICTLLPATLVYAIQPLIPQGSFNIPPQLWPTDPVWSRYLIYHTIRKFVEEICLSNYACYIFIYYITSAYFREECKRMFIEPFLNKGTSQKTDGKRTTSLTTNCTVVDSAGKTILIKD
ncbi:hypothetical protein ACJMK2_043989 [Sinanodonta woodiana]|uniref:G-protein coupled receptors family 1 profile domain-containing protein n=1 Tax=Sinanodonta woodiana TaxID=1069815 RepID=A0ABD3W1G3_SINWO